MRRTVLQVEALEDRCTPNAFNVVANAIAHHFHNNHTQICNALDRAHTAAVAHHAPASVLNFIGKLETHFNC